MRNIPRCSGVICDDCLMLTGILVPFVFRDGEYHFLFQKRAQGIRQGGEISFPGGRFDPALDRTTADTALRETHEELGIEKHRIRIHRRLGTLVGGIGVVIDVYPGELLVASAADLSPAPDEVEMVFSVPVRFFEETLPLEYKARMEMKSVYTDDAGKEVVAFPAKELGLPEQYHRSWAVRDHAIYVYRWSEHIIWGITAKIVRDVVRSLGKQ